jgi:Domain of unknown function (DUF4157)
MTEVAERRKRPASNNRRTEPAGEVGLASPARRESCGQWQGLGAVALRAPAGLGMQPSLRVGPAASDLEREADAIAERITGPEAASAAPSPAGAPIVQRMCTGCEAAEDQHVSGKHADDDDQVLGKFGGAAGTMSPVVNSQIRSLPGRGAPLPPSERAFFEPRLGHSLGGVRIHTGREAGDAAHAIGARAFTHRSDVGFAPGQYSPGTDAGRRLLAHELVHVVQQSGLSAPPVQRDLATPAPSPAPASQLDLTPAQIQSALAFNRARFDAARTRLIQDIVGSKPTGVWTEEDVRLVGQIQADYGLNKDGLVGAATFRLLDTEVRNEKIAHTDAHCLLSFNVVAAPTTDDGIVGGQRKVHGNVAVDARFSSTCGCAAYEFRQFIRGHVIRHPAGGGPAIDISPNISIPGGGLKTAFVEDGDTSDPVPNYGHRADAAESNPVNHYTNDSGVVDQAAGCHYQNTDQPTVHVTFAPGDSLDVDMNFRGEIQRAGKVVETRTWTGLHGVFH